MNEYITYVTSSLIGLDFTKPDLENEPWSQVTSAWDQGPLLLARIN